MNSPIQQLADRLNDTLGTAHTQPWLWPSLLRLLAQQVARRVGGGESGLLALRRDVYEFYQDVDELRGDVDRLDARIQRLKGSPRP